MFVLYPLVVIIVLKVRMNEFVEYLVLGTKSGKLLLYRFNHFYQFVVCIIQTMQE